MSGSEPAHLDLLMVNEDSLFLKPNIRSLTSERITTLDALNFYTQ